jgi:phosphoribosylamine-glycine ligase
MGSYSCPDGSLPFLTEEDVALARTVNEATIAALGRETGTPYRGVLYGGFMAVAGGVRLIEYNARFGDPEAMNVLPLFTGDLVELMWATSTGRLGQTKTSFETRATVCKYVVPSSYPEGSSDGGVVSTDDSALGSDLRCYWAATELATDSSIRLTGSRGLAFVGIGDTLATAEALAERGASSVSGPVRHRGDIGTQQAMARRAEHMLQIRPTRTA